MPGSDLVADNRLSSPRHSRFGDADAALAQFQIAIESFISQYAAEYGVQGAPAQIHQYPLNIET